MSTGERKMFGLLGHPVSHSVSPAMHSAAFRALRLPHVYSAFDVPSDLDLARFVDDIRNGLIAGANVTVPHKRAVMSLVDELDPSAEGVGAANVLCGTAARRVVGYNSDALALEDELGQLLDGGEASKAPAARQRAMIIGAGGAAFASLVACKRLGFKLISMTTRSWGSSEQMLDASAGQRARDLGALTAPWPVQRSIPSSKSSQALRLSWTELAVAADLVIQATSAGMLGGAPGEDVAAIVPWDALSPAACVYDVVYNPPVTPFLRMARARGLRASDGLGMLVGQAARSFTLWTGLPAPVEVMRAAAEDSLKGPRR